MKDKIKEILSGVEGVDSTAIKAVTDAVTKVIGDQYVKKDLYTGKVGELDTKNGELKDLKTQLDTATKDAKTAVESLDAANLKITDLEDYKANTETTAVKDSKLAKINELLTKEGIAPSLSKLLVGKFDLDKVELKDNEIEGWDGLINPIKEEFKDLFEVSKKPDLIDPPGGTGNPGKAAGGNIDLRSAVAEQLGAK